MKVTLYSSISVNGMLADKDGSEEFLSDYDWEVFSKLAKKNKCLIVGRKTYEKVNLWKDYNFDSIKNTSKIIVSSNNLKLKKDYYLARNPMDALNIAKRLGLRSALVAGGSKLNGSFLKSNLIDQIILNVDPVLVGNGINFLSADLQTKLRLKRIRKLKDGIIQLQYIVI